MKKGIRSIAVWTALAALLLGVSGCGFLGSDSESANAVSQDMLNQAMAGQDQKRLSLEEYNKLAARHKTGDEKLMDAADPNDPYRLELQGDGLVAEGEMAAALFKYQRALTLVPESIKARLKTKIGFALLKEGRHQEAANIFVHSAKPASLASQIYLGLGLAKMSLGELEAAESSLSKAIASGHASWKAYNALGIVYNKLGRHAKALTLFNRAIAMNPREAALYNNRGLAQMMGGQPVAAERSFIKALRLDPDHTLARNNLGLLYSSQNRWPEARRIFAEAVGEAKAYNNLGVLLAYGGQYLRARESFRKAVENSPTYYGLADSNYSSLEDMAEIRPASYSPIVEDAGAGQGRQLFVNPEAVRPAPQPEPKTTRPATAAPQAKAETARQPAAAVKTQVAGQADSGQNGDGYRYYVQVASIRDFSRVQGAMNHWMEKGYSCQVDLWTSKKQERWYRLLIGPFKGMDERQGALNQMIEEGSLKDYVLVRRKLS